MYYEIYIDVFFVSELLLDYLLLLFVWRVLFLSSNHVRILLGAAVGALLACIVILIPLQIPVVKLAFFHLIINSVMIKTAFQIPHRRMFWEAFGLLYISACLMGGVLHFLGNNIPQNGVLFAAVIGYYLMRGMKSFVKRLHRDQKSKCRVVLYTSTGTYELQALLDTGNELRDAVSKKSVSMIGNELAKEIFSDEEMKTVRYVPYASIGKSGVIPAVRIRKMCVYLQDHSVKDTFPKERNVSGGNVMEICVEGAVIGISERKISTKDAYQIILNPDISDER